MLFTITRCISHFLSKADEKFEFVHDLFYEPREKRRTFKTCLSFVYGALIGLSFYNFVLNPIGIEFKWKILAACLISLLCALFSTLSAKFRCISLLVWFEGFSRTGRSLINALIIALVLIGPVNNITLHMQECARVFECTSNLAYNLTKTKFDLAVKPFTNAFIHMHEKVKDVKEKFHEARDVIEPIFHEIEQPNTFQGG